MFGLQMDRLALEERKRCIMWDDEGAGFYLVSSLVQSDCLGCSRCFKQVVLEAGGWLCPAADELGLAEEQTREDAPGQGP